MQGAVWWLTVSAAAAIAAPQDDCPEECECLLLKNSWITDCSEASLNQLPKGVGAGSDVLNLEGNSLAELEPALPEHLKEVRLAHNLLTEVPREAFCRLQNLTSLDISHNQISFIHPEAFVDNTELRKLELQNNTLQEVTGIFLLTTNLTELDLRDCGLSSISTEFFGELTSLETLDLSGNPLGTIAEGALAPLESLKYLKLNRCNLTFIDIKTFSSQVRLTSLELSLNTLETKIDWSLIFGGLPLLEQLDLTASGLTHLPEDVFFNNGNMKSLILAENRLRDMDVATSLGQNLKHLDFLNLSNCELTGPLSESAFSNATKLHTLILSGNHMKAEDLAAALAPLTRIHNLSLRNCSLTHLPNDTFHRFTSIQQLDISHNPLSEAFTSMLTPLRTVELLDMSNANLQHINESTFSKMSSLKRLILSGNPLKTLDPELFSNLTHLKILELSDCGLKRLDNYGFPDLEELLLSKNPLEVPEKGTFLPKRLSKLHKLELSHCNITYLSKDSLSHFTNLSWLSLSGNRLGDNSLGFLNGLTHLRSLDLSNNNLKLITPSNLKNNKQIRSLRLSGNPWRCGCYVKEMWSWALESTGELETLVGDSAAKRRRPLTCQFHWAGPPGRRPSSGTVSWGRYARDPEACAAARAGRSLRAAPPPAAPGLPAPPCPPAAPGHPAPPCTLAAFPLPYMLGPALVATLLILTLLFLKFRSSFPKVYYL